ncbi:phage protein [Niallia circulans]|uniref:Phage protein n=1 Tax=Niallia circulans TaxID=1397 RepID=A0A0J1LBB9_NIACI|nr:phage protein [Niallia circulans]KLV26215.1 phage protein [Niallia circulans]
MQINFQQLRDIMKQSGMPVYRDDAPTTATYPYIVYEYVNEIHRRASNKVLKSMSLYQISIITNGTEKDYEPLKRVFNDNGVEYSMFTGIPYDENDDTVIQYITNVRCVN